MGTEYEKFLKSVGGQQNESNANDASIQPTPANAKSSNGNAAHVRSDLNFNRPENGTRQNSGSIKKAF